jgi:glutamyl-tRNA reductase
MVMVLIGASHHDLPLEALDPIAKAADQIAGEITTLDCIRGSIRLTTCNRVEFYIETDLFHDGVDHVTQLISGAAGLPHEYVRDVMRVTVGPPIAEHLFSVAAGLESMVVGENEVSGQVGDALEDSRNNGDTTPSLERLFQQASRTAKQVSSSTGLGAAGRSLVGVGLDLVINRHGPLADKSALVIGTGAYARISTQSLRSRGCQSISNFSATGRAQHFADSHDLQAVDADHLPELMPHIDLIVACSGVHDFVVDDSYAAIISTRTRVLPIIDLALHSDIHPDIRALEAIDYINLVLIGEHAPTEHAGVIDSARQVVRDSVEAYGDSELGRSADPMVVALRTRFDEVVAEEVNRVRRQSGDIAADAVALSLHRVTSSLLHTPTMRARQMAKIGDGLDYARAIHLVFGVDVPLDETQS